MTLKVPCPQCQKEVVWQASSEFRPFCSERCKLLDLGEWADESNKISEPIQVDSAISQEMLDAIEDDILLNNNFFVEPE
ncbi:MULTISPECIES: DNA gyrase inhibitor YacG [Colwellia]|uniref:DNA gyrase inhibitor YacG n=1 Tax=Colwellia marinimaniae TaxID=1513592 RepID=A0ABQ0MQ82_9GAMM|nr:MULTISPECIES: DNA gyrase inhibitor YacG [Colwellia]GAW94521.1 DNA gyrase inhibitor YacG [Colwellia marinimaniae]